MSKISWLKANNSEPDERERKRAEARLKQAERIKLGELELPQKLASSKDPLLDVYQAAAYCGRHPQTLREAVALRELACCRRGQRGHLRFRLSHLDAWLRRQEQRPSRASA